MSKRFSSETRSDGRKSVKRTAKNSVSTESIRKTRKSSSAKNLKEVVDDVPKNINFKEKLVYFLFNNMIENFIEDYQPEGSAKCMCSLPDEKIVADLLPPLKKRQWRSAVSRSVSSISVPKRSSSSKIVLRRPPDWLIPTFSEKATTVFTNGNIYTGETSNRVMHGWGTFRWSDGTIYTGQFENGRLTGNGTMRLPDLSVYEGGFCNGYFHGHGTLNVANAAMIYKGDWKYGKRHGKGWMFYGTDNWYDGDWFEDEKQGFGERQYNKQGTKYKGEFFADLRNGQGTMVFDNNDFYKGEWKGDLMHGYGEYFWNCNSSRNVLFTPTTYYKGNWVDGKRTGVGLMNFGNETGLKLYGMWRENDKHGAGVMICGNGHILSCNPLFEFDKPVQRKAIQTRTNNHVQIDPFLYRRINELLNRKCSLEMFNEDILNCVMRNSELIPKNQFVFCAARNTDCCPLNITMNSNSNQLNFEYLIELVSRKFEQDFGVSKRDEENQMQDLITLHLAKLMHIYETYAKLDAPNFPGKPLMVRLFLWQLYKDLEFPQRGISLIETDLNLFENPECCLVSKHDPFEEVYFWQFLLSIITNSVYLFDENNIEKFVCKTGLLPQIFLGFLSNDLYNLSLKSEWQSTEIPIQCFYSLYVKIGEPHSVRTFFAQCCTKRGAEPYCFHKSHSKINKTIVYTPMVVGNSLSFTAVNLLHPCIEEPGEKADSYSKNLFVFRKLGKKKLFKCITTVCPSITSDGYITNIDYRLSFIEFYQIILQCTNELSRLQIPQTE